MTPALEAPTVLCTICGQPASGEWLQHVACIRAKHNPNPDRFDPNVRGWRRCTGCGYSYRSTTVGENGCGNCQNQLPGAEQQAPAKKTRNKKTVATT